MRILVTGASGLLGSSITRILVERGDHVTTLQRRPSGVPGAVDVQGSVTDPDAVAVAVAGAEAVVHLAAKVSMAGDPRDFDRINVGGTELLLDAARRAGAARWVQVSSPSVAHTGDSLVGEGAGAADPARARGDYARTKAAGELAALAADSDAFRVLAVRPHLMWGPGDTQLTERIIERAKAGRMPIIGTGAALVDTLYIDNAVSGIVRALDRSSSVHGEALVLTNAQPRPIGELLRSIAMAGGAQPPRLRIPAPVALAAGTFVEKVWGLREHEDEPPLTHFLAEQLSTAHWFDQRRTQEALGWQPTVSIDEGLERLREYYSR